MKTYKIAIMQIQGKSAKAQKGSLARYILLAGITAGALDATAASIQYYIKTGKNPQRVFQFIASGVFGKDAFNGGWLMALYGLLFHFCIAFLFTLFFFLIASRIKILVKRPLISGLSYGIFVWAVMNLIVVPLSNTTKLPIKFPQAIIAALILMVAIGLPLSFFASRYYRGN